ncbi:transposon Ty3-I Gag-Pol polyprotein [Rhizophagus clarus]|uniref:Transposon Ty3-I Gag-Pol polyprotein n=1 Tax=Rhizophagus clarus TaxID=94130 RepID=A0A8H3KYL5_9GLOM|nr:transposon Ty3-I Gag-Pol polyprotein [Rhizophagus clarus]
MIKKQSDENKFEKKMDIGEMSNERKGQIRNLLRKYENIFEYDGEKLEKVSSIKHKIRTKVDQEPILQKRYKKTKKKGKFIKKKIEQLLKMEKIRKSWSPWALPVILAGKKSGNYRFCIDYRKLNAVTKNDAYPLLRL